MNKSADYRKRNDRSSVRRHFAALVFVLAVFAGIVTCMSLQTVSAEDTGALGAKGTVLKERQVRIGYGYTECSGSEHDVSDDGIGWNKNDGTGCAEFTVRMMICDSDHILRMIGDGVSADQVTYTSLSPDVLQVDHDGNVTLLKTGTAEVLASIPADDVYDERTVLVIVSVSRHDGWNGDVSPRYVGRSAFYGLNLDTADGPRQVDLDAMIRPGAKVTCSSGDPSVAMIAQDGTVTPICAGKTFLRFDVDDGGGRYNAGSFIENITVTGEDRRLSQEISGDPGPFTVTWSDGCSLEYSAKTPLTYEVCRCSGSGVTVSEDGDVSFEKPLSCQIKVEAEGTSEYKPAEKYVTINAIKTAEEEAAEEAAAKKAAEEAAAKKAAEEEAAKKAAEEAAAKAKAEEEAAKKAAEEEAAAEKKAEIAEARSLKKPTLKVKRLKGNKNKLTWSKVKHADGYRVYVKYPGKKKYVLAVTKSARVKSITHRGLSKGKNYSYKVEAFKVVDGVRYCGPMSGAKKVRVR